MTRDLSSNGIAALRTLKSAERALTLDEIAERAAIDRGAADFAVRFLVRENLASFTGDRYEITSAGLTEFESYGPSRS